MGVRFYESPNLKVTILVGCFLSFLYAARSPGAQLMS